MALPMVRTSKRFSGMERGSRGQAARTIAAPPGGANGEAESAETMSFARKAAGVGVATLVSRVLGFARDVMVASALGAGPAADAFVVAFRLPGLVRRLLAEGAINSAFIPVYAEAGSEPAARRLADEIATLVAAGLAALTALALAAMPWLVGLVAPGFAESGGAVGLATELSRITFPYCLATALMVVASA